jgi:hypothetical protein
MMRVGEQREQYLPQAQCLVLSRACADLYDEVAGLFASERGIAVVVDRRRADGDPPGFLDPVRPQVVA